jgi:phosphoserine aminotransferase
VGVGSNRIGKVFSNDCAAGAEAARAALSARMVALIEAEGAGYDFGAYRAAPPGFRIWCGATVETADVALLTQWLDWAYAEAVSGGV